MFPNFLVVKTERERPCDRAAPIKSLVLDQPFNGYTVHSIQALKELADAGRLSVQKPLGGTVRVRIFWSAFHQRWIATTAADNITCDNLLALPVVYPTSESDGVIFFGSCAL